MPNDNRNRPVGLDAVHRFFRKRVSSLEAGSHQPDICAEVQCQHVVGYLVERTVARASLLAADRRSAPASAADASWKHHLMTAALTELRTLDV